MSCLPISCNAARMETKRSIYFSFSFFEKCLAVVWWEKPWEASSIEQKSFCGLSLERYFCLSQYIESGSRSAKEIDHRTGEKNRTNELEQDFHSFARPILCSIYRFCVGVYVWLTQTFGWRSQRILTIVVTRTPTVLPISCCNLDKKHTKKEQNYFPTFLGPQDCGSVMMFFTVSNRRPSPASSANSQSRRARASLLTTISSQEKKK